MDGGPGTAQEVAEALGLVLPPPPPLPPSSVQRQVKFHQVFARFISNPRRHGQPMQLAWHAMAWHGMA